MIVYTPNAICMNSTSLVSNKNWSSIISCMSYLLDVFFPKSLRLPSISPGSTTRSNIVSFILCLKIFAFSIHNTPLTPPTHHTLPSTSHIFPRPLYFLSKTSPPVIVCPVKLAFTIPALTKSCTNPKITPSHPFAAIISTVTGNSST